MILDDDDIARLYAGKVPRAEGAPPLIQEIASAIRGALAFARAQKVPEGATCARELDGEGRCEETAGLPRDRWCVLCHMRAVDV